VPGLPKESKLAALAASVQHSSTQPAMPSSLIVAALALVVSSSPPALMLTAARAPGAICATTTNAAASEDKDLDSVPVFSLANADGQLLQYERGGAMVAMFFCDVDRALRELSVGRARSPSLGLQLLPVGLGAAVRHSNAVFVPGRDELVAAQEAQLAAPSEAAAMLAEAGLPSPVARWDEEHIPLFSCMRFSASQARRDPFLTPLHELGRREGGHRRRRQKQRCGTWQLEPADGLHVVAKAARTASARTPPLSRRAADALHAVSARARSATHA